jgi:hypothetical protein
MVIACLLVALVTVGVVIVIHQKAAADTRQAAQAMSARMAADKAATAKAAEESAAAAKVAAREARKQAAADKIAAAKEAKVMAAAEKVAKAKAAAHKAAKLQAAAEKTAAKKAARAVKKAARLAAKRAAQHHTIQGQVTVPDVNGALAARVGGKPGQAFAELSVTQLEKIAAMSKMLKAGLTYPCKAGSGGRYADVVAGGQVVVQDGTGATLGTSKLTGGVLDTHGCTFDFRVEVSDVDVYRVAIAHRNAAVYPRAAMVAKHWQVNDKL